MTAAMGFPEEPGHGSEKSQLREAFCASCDRTAYLGPDSPPACPVCSSPLVEKIGKSGDETA